MKKTLRWYSKYYNEDIYSTPQTPESKTWMLGKYLPDYNTVQIKLGTHLYNGSWFMGCTVGTEADREETSTQDVGRTQEI